MFRVHAWVRGSVATYSRSLGNYQYMEKEMDTQVDSNFAWAGRHYEVKAQILGNVSS